MELLRRHEVPLQGAEAVVVGRSDLVGRPLAALLLAAHATVTVYTPAHPGDLGAVCRRAELPVAAVGRPRIIRPMGSSRATVIDVGVTRTDDGLAGDVDFEAAAERAGLITPVPGGVGPMTIAVSCSATRCWRRGPPRRRRSRSGTVELSGSARASLSPASAGSCCWS